MREEHVIRMLEDGPLASLGEDELRAVRAHAAACAECARAYEAARLSALLVRERAAETIEPSPFFQTRVLAALRERQSANEAPALRRMWKAAGALVSSMAVTVAALAVFTVFAPGPSAETGEQSLASSSSGRYSAEAVILEQDEQPVDQMSDAQVLTTIYSPEDDAAR